MREKIDQGSITIRTAVPLDAQDLAHLARTTYRAHFSDLWSPAGLTRYLDEQFDVDKLISDISSGSARYYITRKNGQQIGYAKLVFDRRLPVGDMEIGVELEKIYFAEDVTGFGLGGALIRHVLADVRAAGHSTIWLDVLKTNDHGRRAYERQGFAVVGELPFATDLRDIDFWVMARDMSSSGLDSLGVEER